MQSLLEMDGICFIAGYPDELEQCFFNYNPGLKRRFSFHIHIDGYSSDELSKMFQSKLKGGIFSCEDAMTLDQSVKIKELDHFFDTNKKVFEYFGGDIDLLLFHSKMVANIRSFKEDSELTLKMDDITKGLEELKTNKRIQQIVEENPSYLHLYS